MRDLISENCRRRLLGFSGVLLASWSVLAAAGWAGFLGWQAELFANFPLAPVLAAIGAVPLLARYAGRFAAVLGGLALALVIGFTFFPKPVLEAGVRDGTSLRFATWNAFLGKLDPEEAIRWIAANDPDVIAFTEITKPLHQLLTARLGDRYPFRIGNPRGGPAGLAIFSKVPIANWERQPADARYASFELQWPGGPMCRVIVAHPPAPTRGAWFRARADDLRAIAAELAKESWPAIVLGDFNATWAVKDFREFCRVSNLLPASDYRTSWNAALPEVLRISIDHVLARSGDFLAVAAVAGDKGAGSDHLPVLAEIQLRPRSLAATR